MCVQEVYKWQPQNCCSPLPFSSFLLLCFFTTSYFFSDMICPITSFSLSPSTTVIDLFSEQGALNATTHSITGTVTFQLSCHTVIRAIFIKLKGVSRSVHQRHPERLRITDTHAMFVLCKEKTSVLEAPFPLDAGEHTLPWTLSFPCDSLPPTINLPQHQIAYALSARVIADGYIRRPSLRTSMPVVINRHSLGAVHLASYIPNIRYRGQRTDKIRYEFELPKMACMQLRRFDFNGKLVCFLEGCRALKVAVRLDQIETYRYGYHDCSLYDIRSNNLLYILTSNL